MCEGIFIWMNFFHIYDIFISFYFFYFLVTCTMLSLWHHEIILLANNNKKLQRTNVVAERRLSIWLKQFCFQDTQRTLAIRKYKILFCLYILYMLKVCSEESWMLEDGLFFTQKTVGYQNTFVESKWSFFNPI